MRMRHVKIWLDIEKYLFENKFNLVPQATATHSAEMRMSENDGKWRKMMENDGNLTDFAAVACGGPPVEGTPPDPPPSKILPKPYGRPLGY